MLGTITRSPYSRWEVLLLAMDSKPFTELPEIVKRMDDSRIKIFSEKYGDEFAPKQKRGQWNPQYHELLYNLTDVAIRACSKDTRWVAITNGDNEYDEAFMDRLEVVPDQADIAAFSYYSRYQRPTARPCDRFAAGPGLPLCKDNTLSFCQTDLGANVLNWKRFTSENRSFGAMPSLGMGLNDGLLAESLVQAGWKVHKVSDKCLFSHSPSPQVCALEGGVWDDSTHGYYPVDSPCITEAEADAKVAASQASGNNALEMNEIELSNDGKSFGMTQHKGPLTIKCIRPAGTASTSAWANKYFPPACAAKVDGGRA